MRAVAASTPDIVSTANAPSASALNRGTAAASRPGAADVDVEPGQTADPEGGGDDVHRQAGHREVVVAAAPRP
jgi:hypothetical protein